MDATNLFRSMLAGDIPGGAKLVGYTARGDGPELTLYDVLEHTVTGPSVEKGHHPGDHWHPDDRVTVKLRSPGRGDYIMVHKANDQLTVTGIRST